VFESLASHVAYDPTVGGSRDIRLCDVGPRDGLQNEATVLEPAVRAELVDRLAAAGLPRVEACSFVNPERVPAMAGAEEVVERVTADGDLTLCGLVLNLRGYERLAHTRIAEVHFSCAATESFNRRNQNAAVAESMAAFGEISARAHAEQRRATMTIGVAFGCPFEGAVAPATVLALAEQAVALGADEVVLADTIGVGVPRQVRELVTGARAFDVPLGIHLHNTRNTGYANAWAAIEAGATGLDASVGGLGGCPFAPNATGNIATEDLVYLLHGEGVATGVDLDALIATADWLDGIMGARTPGLVHRAGGFDAVAPATLR
jgi:hydroxymethylglutaryl-CoA lyase/(R)-citramalyl-CoA lyase